MRVMIDEMTGRDSNLRKIDLFSPTSKWSVWGDMVEEMSVAEPQEPQEPEKPQAPQETKALTDDEQHTEPTDKEDKAPDHQKTDPSDGTNTHQKQVTSAASVLCSSAPQKSEDDAATRRGNLRTRLELTVGQKLALAELSFFELNENQDASFDFQRCLIRHNSSDPRHARHTDMNHREYSGRDQHDQRTLGLNEGQTLALGEFGSWRRNRSA